MRAAVSWSGGKDCCLALYRAIKNGLIVTDMVNFINEARPLTMSHGLPPELVQLQAESLGLNIVQPKVSWDSYEQGYRDAFGALEIDGVEALVNGDIDLPEGVEWNRKMCAEVGLELVMPILDEDPESLLLKFIDAGFEARIVTVNTTTGNADLIGKDINREFLEDLKARQENKVHLCGELGEFHTVVTDGPIFMKKIEIYEYKPVYVEGYVYLDITGYRSIDKISNTKVY